MLLHLFSLLTACSDPMPPGTEGSGGETGDPEEVDTDSGEGTCSVALTCGGNVLDDPKSPCTVVIAGPSGQGMYSGPAGVELRGRSSLTFPKPQYAIELRDWSELPVWPGSVWRYEESGADLGETWRREAFDDSAWKSGAAPLGYGESYLATTLDSGPNPSAVPLTTYFRYLFTPASPGNITEPKLGLMVNDGAAVYLNGVEIARENLSEAATASTPATTTVPPGEDTHWINIDILPGLLIDGVNVLAVEVHQADPASVDLRFDLYLEGSGSEVKPDLFGMGENSDWVLDGMYVDRSLMRNRLAFDLFQSFGGAERYAPQGVYCELTLNGVYEGVYSLGENVDRAADRVDIEAGTTPGDTFVIKLDDSDGFHPNALGYGTWQMVYPKDVGAEASVANFLGRWEAASFSDDPGNPDTGIFHYVDRDSAIDWVLIEEFMKNADAYNLSVHLWRDEGGKMHFTPWDLDLSMGYPYTDCGAEGWVQGYPFVDLMAGIPEFHAALEARWVELRAGPLAEAAVLERIAGYDATLAGAVDRNFARWPIDDIAFTTDGVANWLCPVGSAAEEHERVLEFISARLAWMDANIATAHLNP